MTKIFFVFILSAVLQTYGYCQNKNFIDQPYIEINGYADSMITPNEIYIRIILSERDSRDRVSVEENESKMIVGLKNLGINTEKDLTTNDMASNYRFYFLKKRDVMKTKLYTLKVTDAVMVGKVVMLLEDLEIFNASVERVNHSDAEKIKDITRTRAIEKAKRNAVTMTTALGQTLGPAIYITDAESGNTNIETGLNGRLGITVRGMKSLDQYDAPKIEFEKIKVSTTVLVKFILK